MTGKAIVPIVKTGPADTATSCRTQRHDFEGADELAKNQRLIRDHGYYPVATYRRRGAGVRAETRRSSRGCSTNAMRSTVEEWVAWADERLSGNGIQCIVCPGNDDNSTSTRSWPPSKRIMVGEGNVIDLPEKYQLVSSGWTNLTPWDTPREEEETELSARIEAVIAQATAPPERLVLGLHAPPYDTQLDVAPKIDWETLTVQGQDQAHVGSSAVQGDHRRRPAAPVAARPHPREPRRHPYRSHAGDQPRQLVREGMLSGVVVELDGKDKVKRYRLTSG